MTKQDEQYMRVALKLAKRANPSPNPQVGCILVKNNQIIGKGFHKRAGEAHAEIHAIQDAGDAAKDATLYVNLEPCCHQGRTGPCTQAIIAAGIKKVVIACADPNALVAGKGIEELQKNNIDVQVGICEEAGKEINAAFFHYIQHKKPFVTVKWAMSLDGKTIAAKNDSPKISNAKSHLVSHQFRSKVDAILIGANTAKLDNPLLTARHSRKRVKQPLRIVLSSKGDLPTTLAVFDPKLPAKTILVTTAAIEKKIYQDFVDQGIEVMTLPANENKQINLHALLHELGKRGVMNLLVEGGMQVVHRFFAENLVNRIHVYLAPTIISNLSNKRFLQELRIKKISSDLFIQADY